MLSYKTLYRLCELNGKESESFHHACNAMFVNIISRHSNGKLILTIHVTCKYKGRNEGKTKFKFIDFFSTDVQASNDYPDDHSV